MTNSDNNWLLDSFSGHNLGSEGRANAKVPADLELWTAFKQGKESAFITIYNTYFEALYRYGFQFTKDKSLIKDSIQDLFIELRYKRKNLANTTSIKLYLYKCIRRKILGHKERAINKLITSQDLDGYNFEVIFSVEHQLVMRQLGEENTQKLNKAKVHLTRRQKEAIYYFFYEDLTYDQVSDIMGLNNVKSTRNLVYKAIQVLKSYM